MAANVTANGSNRSMRTMVMKDFYTVPEIAELLRVRSGTVRNRLGRKDRSLPPSILIGRRRLFPVAAYEAWKQRLSDVAL